jgi:methylenetetrahydrofolate dehydrogenase (NADP+)/methenyltetrahydrofolate cyclohydrolase
MMLAQLGSNFGELQMPSIISGKELSEQILSELKFEILSIKNELKLNPCLAVILVGDNPASKVYVANKRRTCEEIGISSKSYELPASTTTEELLKLIFELNTSSSVHGILCQLPLPAQMNEQKVILAINPDKDVDGLHPLNVGLLSTGQPKFVSCTPLGVLEILKRYEIDTSGLQVVVLGRSNLVGRPLATLLSQKSWDATVTICHSRTKNLKAQVKRADVIIAAIGQPNFVTGDMLKEGVVVIDVGINRLPPSHQSKNGKLCGDVDFESAFHKASWITPVPGGVGPMTITMLMKNTILATRLQASKII